MKHETCGFKNLIRIPLNWILLDRIQLQLAVYFWSNPENKLYFQTDSWYIALRVGKDYLIYRERERTGLENFTQ